MLTHFLVFIITRGVSLFFNFFAAAIFSRSTQKKTANTVPKNNKTPFSELVKAFAATIVSTQPESTPKFTKLSRKPFKNSPPKFFNTNAVVLSYNFNKVFGCPYIGNNAVCNQNNTTKHQ